MTVLIFGAAGFLGRRFVEALPEAVGTTADIADARAVAAELSRVNPSVVVNCAGKTGRPNVDWCETHRGETLRSNLTGPLVLLQQCLEREIRLVHLGSGCVFQGDNGGVGFRESDPPNFRGSYYARVKQLADAALCEFPVLILRVRMVFDDGRDGRDLLAKLLRYPRVVDQPNSLTYVPDLLEAAQALIEHRRTGLFHIVNPGAVSPFDVVRRYQRNYAPTHSCEPLSADELARLVVAPRSHCVLSSERLDQCGIQPRHVDTALQDAFERLATDDSAPLRP